MSEQKGLGGAFRHLPRPEHALSPPPARAFRSLPGCEAGAPPSGRRRALLREAAEVASGSGRADMAEEVRQELSALAAIFCGPHEWEMLSCSGECPASHPAATAGSRGNPGFGGPGPEWEGRWGGLGLRSQCPPLSSPSSYPVLSRSQTVRTALMNPAPPNNQYPT